MKRELFFKINFLAFIFIQSPINGLEGFSVLQLTPPPLWALLDFTVVNITSLQVIPTATTSATCKMTCFVQTNCSYAIYQMVGGNAECRMASLNKTTIYRLSPLENSISIFNPNGYGLYGITNIIPSKFPKLSDQITEVTQYTKLYYSLREPHHIYWVLNNYMLRAEAIQNCSLYDGTELAYFLNLTQLEIGLFILLDQNSTLTAEQRTGRPTIHVDMITLGTDTTNVATWPVLVGPNKTSISQTVFAGDPRVQINGQPAPTNTLYLQWFNGITFNDHSNDDKAAALCRTKVFGNIE